MTKTITIQLTGVTTKRVPFQLGETVASITKRVAGPGFASNLVQTWFANGVPVSGTTKLTEDMKLMGVPKVDGGIA